MDTPSPNDHNDGRQRYRAWHRGTREADYMVGGFFDRYHAEWSDADRAWFDRLLACEDVDIMAWAMKMAPVPPEFDGPQMAAMQKLDYIEIPGT
ncbi:succinate dehydrogenase assembly factor 2 [Alterisphingorhabdus coralli]|uniref:FAD assembly factor SdhE n=1 Tax=Alterisphingorhabdus coralli TaxID=3071408 RepID=A0AA97F6Q0_9SPHN|nr:succinate dehydrogenase assembly factor 2 [Parasphingorhabdus sp. SCSIO 66989]WOE74112.1 succinate dehydrogenase assembly factor 2 [Parasphingorhabdus sp. SCSIO 66989]